MRDQRTPTERIEDAARAAGLTIRHSGLDLIIVGRRWSDGGIHTATIYPGSRRIASMAYTVQTYVPGGRGWPERLAAKAAQILKEIEG